MTYSTFQNFKMSIINFTGLEKDALHIYVGIGVFLLTSLLFKNNRYRWFFALAVAVLAACLGEVWDRAESLHNNGVWDWHASLHDILNTCFFPTLFFILLQWTRFFYPSNK